MTITRAAFAAIAEFVATLPEYVPAPKVTGSIPVLVDWDGSLFSFYVGTDGEIMPSVRNRVRDGLIAHYRPKPRRFAVLVHTPHGLASLEAARGTSVFLDTPENRAYCAKEGETWLTFDLVERVG